MINGLGGAFVFSQQPEALAAWYSEHFGMRFEGSAEFGAFYQQFWAANPDAPEERWDTTFAIMQAAADYARPAPDAEPDSMYGDQPFMVNLRMSDLDATVAALEASGVAIIKRQDEPYGKFAWVRDLDGNRVELYQPIPPAS